MSDGEATFWSDASRRTRRTEATHATKVILILGCSYTQGFDVRDDDTYAWKLQQRFPQYDVRNFGTGGYGAYQSLLRFRRWMFEGHRTPDLVIYGFGDFHGVRDRATRSWMSQLVHARAFVPPHVELIRERLVEYPGRSIELSDWSRESAVWNLAEAWYTRASDFAPDDYQQTTRVEQALLQQFHHEVTAAGSKFLLANLWTTPDAREMWRSFFAASDLPVADCVADGLPFRHPDLFWLERHADCIEQAIRADRFLGD